MTSLPSGSETVVMQAGSGLIFRLYLSSFCDALVRGLSRMV